MNLSYWSFENQPNRTFGYNCEREIEFIWSWILQLFHWILLMHQNVGRHQIKGKFVIVFIGKKEIKIHVESIDWKITGLILKIVFDNYLLSEQKQFHANFVIQLFNSIENSEQKLLLKRINVARKTDDLRILIMDWYLK